MAEGAATALSGGHPGVGALRLGLAVAPRGAEIFWLTGRVLVPGPGGNWRVPGCSWDCLWPQDSA